jgi:hypothetical protein
MRYLVTPSVKIFRIKPRRPGHKIGTKFEHIIAHTKKNFGTGGSSARSSNRCIITKGIPKCEIGWLWRTKY